jgi:hypothetical protein
MMLQNPEMIQENINKMDKTLKQDLEMLVKAEEYDVKT